MKEAIINSQIMRCFRYFGYILFVLILYFVVKILYSNLLQVQWSQLSVSYYFVALAFLFEILSKCFLGVSYYFFLSLYGFFVPFKRSVWAGWCIALGKYIPGKMGVFIGSVYILNRNGVNKITAGIIPFFITLFTLFFASFLSVPVWISISNSPFLFQFNWHYYLVFLFVGTLMLAPAMGKLFYSFHENFRKMPPINDPANLPILFVHWAVFFQVLCSGIATWMMLRAVYHMSPSSLFLLVSLNAFSLVMGSITFFVPAGLGIRDGAFFIGLTHVIPVEIAALSVVLIRILQILSDIITGGFAFVCLKKDRLL